MPRKQSSRGAGISSTCSRSGESATEVACSAFSCATMVCIATFHVAHSAVL